MRCMEKQKFLKLSGATLYVVWQAQSLAAEINEEEFTFPVYRDASEEISALIGTLSKCIFFSYKV